MYSDEYEEKEIDLPTYVSFLTEDEVRKIEMFIKEKVSLVIVKKRPGTCGSDLAVCRFYDLLV